MNRKITIAIWLIGVVLVGYFLINYHETYDAYSAAANRKLNYQIQLINIILTIIMITITAEIYIETVANRSSSD